MSSYDHNLLDEAPRATRAQLQEGYNVDLLEQPPRRTPSVHTPPPQTSQTVPLTPTIAETGAEEKFTSPVSKTRTSFWRSRNGIITIAVILLVVIGAVVGGAVGGTVSKQNTDDVAKTGTTSTSNSSVTSTMSSNATQGTGGETSRPQSFPPTSATPTSSGIQNTS